MILTFQVDGVPRPKGSTQSFGYLARDEQGVPRTRTTAKGKVVPVIRTATKSASPGNAAWEAEVAKAAMLAMANSRPRFRRVEAGPVTLQVEFRLPLPQRLKRAPGTPHTGKPDLDKLARSVADALTGVAWADDMQVDELRATKAYANVARGAPGVDVTVWRSGEMP